MKSKIAFWILTILSSLIVVYILVSIVLQPVFTKNPLPKVVVRTFIEKAKNGKTENIKPVEDTIPASEMPGNIRDAGMKLLETRKKEVLLQSRLTLANDDSMYLVLDLVRNIAILEIKGIVLHECRIVDLHISNSIKRYPPDALLNWMSEPFSVKRTDATIPKIQFIEKIAPKDTLEANKMVVEPTLARLGDVYIVMDFDRNLRLVIAQSEVPDEEGKRLISNMKKKYSRIEIVRSLNSLSKFNREPAKPQIEIVIPKSDATILYKALPLSPRMILRM
jgi:hypothetical protein